MDELIKVVHFQRKPLPIHKSLEYIFADVRSRMPSNIQAVLKVFSVYSTGILNRLKIVWEAYRNRGPVNHVTGDVHFATILLPVNRTMLTVLDCGFLSTSRGMKHQLLKFFWLTLPLRSCALVTVISEATKTELLKFSSFPAEKVHVIPVAISNRFKPVAKLFNRQKPTILLIGTVPNKNLDRVIEAVRGLSCQLNIIGALPADIKLKLESYNINYTNSQNLSDEELKAQYENCDLLSFVSLYEGFGMPIVEANAVGRAVVTSNILSMPEVAGDAACLVDPYDIQSISDGIKKVIEDENYRQRLIENGFYNCQRFDADRIAGMYFDLYKKLADSNSHVAEPARS